MVTRELERVAFNNKEWNTICFILDSYAGEYFEGEIDSARDKFNSLFDKIPLKVVSKLEDITVFDSIKELCANRIDCAVTSIED